MSARLTFIAIAAFWLTMNFWLWRAEFGSHSGEMPVPAEMVWRKILTAPDTSSLNVYEGRERMGYCEFSTGVGRRMAELEDDKLPPEGLVARAGYQVHFAGNVALSDFTNRVKFDGRASFSPNRQWRELALKISTHLVVVEIHSLATNQSVQVKITNDGVVLEREIALADLQNPGALLRAFAGNVADTLLGAVDLPEFSPAVGAQTIHWDARRIRIKIGAEFMPAYRLETHALGYAVAVDVSTLGEILRVQLPGEISARIDEWIRP